MTTVLAIDDEQDILLMIKVSLEMWDCRVLTAETGEEGIDLATREHPDLILLDIRLPGIDGWEVLDRIKGDAVLAATPVVMISAHSSPGTPGRAMHAGCAGYLTKPFRPSDLKRAIEDAARS